MPDERTENRTTCGKYIIFKQSKNAQKTCLAFQKAQPGRIVAVKHSEAVPPSQTIVKTAHPSIVNILDVFFHDRVYHLAYEKMEVSLQQMNSCFKLNAMEIASICKMLLLGVSYIHQDLNIRHNRIKCDNIFFDKEGSVKIGDIGASLLEGLITPEQYDIRSIGLVHDYLGQVEDVPTNNNLKYPTGEVLWTPQHHSTPVPKRGADAETASKKRNISLLCKERSPWDSYMKFATMGWSKTTTLAVGPYQTSNIVAVKEQKPPRDFDIRDIIETGHVNVVKLQDAYFWNSVCYLVYEKMDITLEQFCTYVRIEDLHVATVSREALSGLSYIYDELKCSYHGNLYYNLFLTFSGVVKIGNVGESMIGGTGEDYDKMNMAGVGTLILHMVQPGTVFLNPGRRSLVHHIGIKKVDQKESL